MKWIFLKSFEMDDILIGNEGKKGEETTKERTARKAKWEEVDVKRGTVGCRLCSGGIETNTEMG